MWGNMPEGGISTEKSGVATFLIVPPRGYADPGENQTVLVWTAGIPGLLVDDGDVDVEL